MTLEKDSRKQAGVLWVQEHAVTQRVGVQEPGEGREISR